MPIAIDRPARRVCGTAHIAAVADVESLRPQYRLDFRHSQRLGSHGSPAGAGADVARGTDQGYPMAHGSSVVRAVAAALRVPAAPRSLAALCILSALRVLSALRIPAELCFLPALRIQAVFRVLAALRAAVGVLRGVLAVHGMPTRCVEFVRATHFPRSRRTNPSDRRFAARRRALRARAHAETAAPNNPRAQIPPNRTP